MDLTGQEGAYRQHHLCGIEIKPHFGGHALDTLESNLLRDTWRSVDINDLLDYDDVANEQRRVVYQQRADLMELEEIHDTILEMREDVFSDVVDQFVPPGSIDEQWDLSLIHI